MTIRMLQPGDVYLYCWRGYLYAFGLFFGLLQHIFINLFYINYLKFNCYGVQSSAI